MPPPFLLLSKKDLWSNHAGTLAQSMFGERLIWKKGAAGDPAPDITDVKSFGCIISFLSPWIVPAKWLSKSALSINFHPGSCDYPGIGCYNFALYEEAKVFGAVCHHMLPTVDSGVVISESLFSVFAYDRVETLKLRTMVTMLAMFHEIICHIAQNTPLPVNTRQWQRKPFTRKQLNALCEITPEMNEAEKSRRIRSTTYPGFSGPYLLLHNSKKPYPVPPGPPIA